MARDFKIDRKPVNKFIKKISGNRRPKISTKTFAIDKPQKNKKMPVSMTSYFCRRR